MSGSLQVPFPPPAYQLQDLKYDGNRVAAAVEEGRPASLGRSRTAEPGGRELAWSKAKFVVAVLILATQMAGLGIMALDLTGVNKTPCSSRKTTSNVPSTSGALAERAASQAQRSAAHQTDPAPQGHKVAHPISNTAT
ncbi:hypothetical protein CHU98_g5558 [Xylaria longipes]|nr:hypothetical protein CHU98_g5558 [Xylaria longipes]